MLALQVFSKPVDWLGAGASQDEINSLMIADWSSSLPTASFSSDEHGSAVLTFEVQLGPKEARAYYNLCKVAHVLINNGAQIFWTGRIENPRITRTGLYITALGYWRAYYDAPYTGLISTTKYAGWIQMTADDKFTFGSEEYIADNNNRVFIAPVSGSTFSASRPFGGMVYKLPHSSEETISIVSFTYEMAAGMANWDLGIHSYGEGFSPTTIEWFLNGGASLKTGIKRERTFATTAEYLVFYLEPQGSFTYSGDTGDLYAKITNLRIGTNQTYKVATTLGTNISAGSRTVTPGSMANIYVGQSLAIIGSTDDEWVVVDAITTTTFTADFAYSHTSSDPVQAIFIPSSIVIQGLRDFVNGINADQVEAANYSIPSSSEDISDDLTDESWEDNSPANIMIDLAERDNYEVGVDTFRRLYYRAKGSKNRTWHINYTDDLESDLDSLINQYYTVYQDTRGRLIRTDLAEDDESINLLGLKRRKSADLQTTSQATAELYRDELLEEQALRKPRAMMEVRTIMDSARAEYPLYCVKANDELVVKGLPDHLFGKLGNLIIVRTEFVVGRNELLLEVTTPSPSTEQLLGAAARGSYYPSSGVVTIRS